MTSLTGEEILASLSDYEDEVDLAKFARAIEAAVLAKVDDLLKAERERCAKVLEGDPSYDWCKCPSRCAAAIRSLE